MGNVIRTATGTGSRVDGATLVTSNMPIDEAFSGTIASFVLSTTFPIPFLNDLEDSEDSTLYGNSTYSFKFQVSPTLQQDLIVGLGATLTSMGINVTSFELVLPEYKLQSPPLNLKLRRPFYDTRSFRNTFNAQSFQYMIPAATKRVTISFMRHSAAQNTTDAEYVMPTRVLTIAGGTYVQTLGVPGGAAAASLLTRIYVNFNGHNYPKQPYYVKDDDATGATSHRRAYEDYLRLSQSYIAGQKNILATFDQWLEHPVYCMQVTGAPNSSGEAQLSVYTEGLAAGDSNYDICVTADYIKELEIDYNQYGVPEATRVAILA
jgi:hypothetical protein